MAIQSQMNDETNNELIIYVDGRFDFSVLQTFRSAYESVQVKPEVFVIDLEKSSYIDSSALGMLLALRDYAGGDKAKIQIQNCSPDIKKILSITKLDELFTIL